MPECQSWRLSETPHEEVHKPGTCRVCWGECHNNVDDATYPRCRSCYEALAGSPIGWVRLLLVNEETLPYYVITSLVDDGNFLVSGTARWHLSKTESERWHFSHLFGEAPRITERHGRRKPSVEKEPKKRKTKKGPTPNIESEVGTW